MKLHRLPDLIGKDGVFNDGDWVESKDQDPNGDVRLIQLADIGDGEYLDKSDRFLTSQKAVELKCTFLEPGDILVARMPDPLGRACIFPGDSKPCVTVVDVCIVRPDLNTTDRKWLLHKINSPEFRHLVNTFATGTTRKRISRKNLGKLEFPLPPLGEQRRIAAVLDKADELRQKRRAALAKLDTLLQATFLHMFGDPVINPMGWEKRPLEEIVEPNRPITYGILKPGKYENDGIPMLRIQDIYRSKIKQSDMHRVSSDLSNQYKRTVLEGGELVISLVGTLGLVAIVPKTLQGANVHRNLGVIAPNAQISATYLHSLMTLPQFKHFIDQLTKGGIQNLLNLGDLRKLEVPIPPKDLQDRFSALRLKFQKLLEFQETYAKESTNLFHALQQRAFNGRL